MQAAAHHTQGGYPTRPPGTSPPLPHYYTTPDPAQVLEIGSGWGSLALQIARTIPDTTVDTITLSTEQAEYVQELIAQDRVRHFPNVTANGDTPELPAGDRVRVHLLDFRAMPLEWAGAFDRVVSVEMVEAIGRDTYEVRVL